MGLTIQLLGAPSITRNGAGASVRGRKAWALLALLLLRAATPARSELVRLLFDEADDPLGALRWNLAQLRRALGGTAQLGSDPVRLQLPPGTAVDVTDLASTALAGPPTRLSDLPGPLLGDLQFPGCPAFETWLTGERRRLAAMAAALIREDALAAMAAGRHSAAVTLARRLVVADPLDEPHQVLLVQALTAAGDEVAAEQQVSAYTELLADELGAAAPEQIRAALCRLPDPGPVGFAPRATAQAQLDAGRAALVAGAFDAGLDSLRRSVQTACAAAAFDLEIEASVTLGSALIHTVRGRDEEAAAVLHRAVSRASSCGISTSIAHAQRKLATIDLMVGRRYRAEAWFAQAEQSVGTDQEELASITGWRAFNLTDMGHYRDALTQYARSLQFARSSSSPRQVAWSEAGVGRVMLIQGRLEQAATAFESAVSMTRQQNWAAFLPYPEVLLAEVRRRTGDVGPATDLLQHAWALAVQLQDPCWQGIAARGLGLIALAEGRTQDALAWLQRAVRTASVSNELNRWVQTFVRDAVCGTLIQLHLPGAVAAVEALVELAGRACMPEALARAYLHLHHLDRPGALGAARLAAADLDNPELAQLLAAEDN